MLCNAHSTRKLVEIHNNNVLCFILPQDKTLTLSGDISGGLPKFDLPPFGINRFGTIHKFRKNTTKSQKGVGICLEVMTGQEC